MRSLLPRFAFTFVIVGVWLLYEAFHAQQPPLPQWQSILLVVGGALSLGMGLQGIRQRHRDIRKD
jgi:hypothetical protein